MTTADIIEKYNIALQETKLIFNISADRNEIADLYIDESEDIFFSSIKTPYKTSSVVSITYDHYEYFINSFIEITFDNNDYIF